jgi:hypothetical protein
MQVPTSLRSAASGSGWGWWWGVCVCVSLLRAGGHRQHYLFTWGPSVWVPTVARAILLEVTQHLTA